MVLNPSTYVLEFVSEPFEVVPVDLDEYVLIDVIHLGLWFQRSFDSGLVRRFARNIHECFTTTFSLNVKRPGQALMYLKKFVEVLYALPGSSVRQSPNFREDIDISIRASKLNW